MKKKKMLFVILSLCMLLAMPRAAMADTTEEKVPNFWFQLEIGGIKHQSGLVLKEDYANYARIEFWELENNSNLPLIYRLRSGANDTAASAAYEINKADTVRPVYSSGYGRYNYYYYFRMQTDTSSIGSTSYTEGFWVP